MRTCKYIHCTESIDHMREDAGFCCGAHRAAQWRIDNNIIPKSKRPARTVNVEEMRLRADLILTDRPDFLSKLHSYILYTTSFSGTSQNKRTSNRLIFELAKLLTDLPIDNGMQKYLTEAYFNEYPQRI